MLRICKGTLLLPELMRSKNYGHLLKRVVGAFKYIEILSYKALHGLTLSKCSIVRKKKNFKGPLKVCVRTSLWFTGISFAKKLWAALHTLLLLVMPLCNKSRSTECTVGCMLVFYLQTTFREGAALRAAV